MRHKASYMATLVIGADHAGYDLKEALARHLKAREIPFIDVGCNSHDSVDYPDIAEEVAGKIKSGEALQGLLCCGSGVGIAMAANRFPFLRAVVCHDAQITMLSRLHNDANVICFGGRIIAEAYAQDLLDLFLNTHFEGARHQKRIQKLNQVNTGDPAPC
jgi:ribose 5-phosphate isomerase B